MGKVGHGESFYDVLVQFLLTFVESTDHVTCQATEDVFEWEAEFLKAAKYSADELIRHETHDHGDLGFWFEAARSFGDVSASTMFQDISKLVIGILMMSLYVQIILSKFNWVEWRVSMNHYFLRRR